MNSKTVLIVDDSKLDQQLLSQVLSRKTSHKIISANNANDALTLLQQNPIDLILLDNMLPDRSGLDVLKEIRATHNAMNLPIIMITGKTETSDVVEALQAGANDYIAKPVNFEITLSRVQTQLALNETSKQMAKMQEFEAIHAMITTYNHEINNPLTIAIGNLEKLSRDVNNTIAQERVKSSLWRIADIVKEIQKISDQCNFQFGIYANSSKMIKIK